MECEIAIRFLNAECVAWIFFSEPEEHYQTDLIALRAIFKALLANDFNKAVNLAAATEKTTKLFYSAIKQVIIHLIGLGRCEDAKLISERVNNELLRG